MPEDSSTLPAVVIYLIDPFSYGQEWSELHRLAMVGLLRCYQQMVLPAHLQNNTFLQVGSTFVLYALNDEIGDKIGVKGIVLLKCIMLKK